MKHIRDYIIVIPVGVLFLSVLYVWCSLWSGRGENLTVPIITIVISFLLSLVFALVERNDKEVEQYKKTKNDNKRLENEIALIRHQYNDIVEENKKYKDILRELQNKHPFSVVPQMYADIHTTIFDDIALWMRSKQRPAHKSAEIVSELKKQYHSYIYLYKEMEYKYNFLINVFPELKKYVDDDEALTCLSDCEDKDDFAGHQDRVLQWLSQDEYNSLSENERNQLALDRYKQRKKSKWEIGMEYELYIGYLLRTKGYIVKQFGIEKSFNDLGRDIIAEKTYDDGSRVCYIVQCKNWSQETVLHENVVCQLFGTTLEYKIRHNDELFANITNVVPLLVTTTQLSETAKEFARRLGVKVKQQVRLGEYPMIKCNIDSHIYHLPFDQQYYTTRIVEAKGEKFVWTVKEAVNEGYRRAVRWTGV